jgi:cytochrome P450
MRTCSIPALSMRRTIPLLSQLPLSPWLFGNPLEFFEELQKGAEPIARIKIDGNTVFYLRDPDLIREILVTFASNFHKNRGWERAQSLLGKGLITSEDELHRQQRKLIQPIFHHCHLKNLSGVMRERTCERTASWSAGQKLNLSEEMHRLTQIIVGEALFGTDVGDQTSRVSQLMETILETFFLYLGHPALRRAADARRELGEIIQAVIDQRRQTNKVGPDLLTLLFAAQDPNTGFGMSDEQLRDEVMTLFLAGHETSANALSWTIYLLTQHPEIAEQVATEVCSVTNGSELSLLSRVIRESLRLFPPAWAIGRRAVNDLQFAGVTIPKGATVLACQWAMHRCDRYFPNPTKFDPDRWTPEFQRTLPKYAFFPFGGGPRSCIGEGFAWMELEIVLTEILRRWRFEIVPGQIVRPRPSVTLHPEEPIQVIIRPVSGS